MSCTWFRTLHSLYLVFELYSFCTWFLNSTIDTSERKLGRPENGRPYELYSFCSAFAKSRSSTEFKSDTAQNVMPFLVQWIIL